MGMILACMGMAIGTGNIWRFPREVANNGGGSFLIPWIIFLFLWSIPLLMLELSAGKKTRRGPVGAFATLLGSKGSWMGGFMTLCTVFIMCYYAVVSGWTLRYVGYAFQGQLFNLDQATAINLFDSFRSTPLSWVFFVVATGMAAYFVDKGAKGIEMLNRILIPTLILILIIGVIRSLTLPGAREGIVYLFTVDWNLLSKPQHWLAGMTQSAWSTGAGWGLMLAYAVYCREEDDPATTPIATGLGNNGIELLVALMIFPAVFAIMGVAASEFVGSSSSKGGIAFHTIPLLLKEIPGGSIMVVLFFIGLASAALTSLVAMFELCTRFFQDFGIARRKSLILTIILCLVVGTPSALSDHIFDNQDYVWGVGLIISGIFLTVMYFWYGEGRYRADLLSHDNRSGPIGKGFTYLMVFVLLEGIVLLGWFMYGMIQADAGGDTAFFYTGLLQWGGLLLVLILARKTLLPRDQLQDK